MQSNSTAKEAAAYPTKQPAPQNPFDILNNCDDLSAVPDFAQASEKATLSTYNSQLEQSFFAFLTRFQALQMPTSPTERVIFILNTALTASDPTNIVSFRRVRSIDSISILSPDEPHMSISKMSEADSYNDMILEWALPSLLEHLSLDNLLILLGCAMTEMQVVFCCSDISVLSCCITACISLLRPLKWACPIIVTLPDSLHVYLESPVPVVLGVTSLPVGHKPPAGQVVVHVMSNKIELNERDMSQYHTLILPKMSTLHHDLSPHTERLLTEISSKKLEQSQSAAFLRPLSPAYNSIVTSAAVLLSMRRFVDLTRDHVEMLVKSAIELEEEREQQNSSCKKASAASSDFDDTAAHGKVREKRSISTFNERKWWEQRLGGEVGIAFVDRMIETQMYNSLVYERRHQDQRKHKRRHRNTHDTFSLVDDNDCDSPLSTDHHAVQNFSRSRSDSQESLRTKRTRSTTTFSDNFHSRCFSGEENLIGLSDSRIDERRYSAKALRRKSLAICLGFRRGGHTGDKEGRKEFFEVKKELNSKMFFTDLMELVMNGVVRSHSGEVDLNEDASKHAEENENDVEEDDVGVGSSATKEKQAGSNRPFSDPILWCNGMCKGAVNTEFCTMLCVQVWQEKFIKNNVVLRQRPNKQPCSAPSYMSIAAKTDRFEAGGSLNFIAKSKIQKNPWYTDVSRTWPGPTSTRASWLAAKLPSMTNNNALVMGGSKPEDCDDVAALQVGAGATIPSQAANAVHRMLTNRMIAKKRKNAGVLISTYLGGKMKCASKTRPFLEKIAKIQALYRGHVARKEFIKMIMKRRIDLEVGAHLKRKMDSAQKAKKDIDWLFAEGEVEHREEQIVATEKSEKKAIEQSPSTPTLKSKRLSNSNSNNHNHNSKLHGAIKSRLHEPLEEKEQEEYEEKREHVNSTETKRVDRPSSHMLKQDVFSGGVVLGLGLGGGDGESEITMKEEEDFVAQDQGNKTTDKKCHKGSGEDNFNDGKQAQFSPVRCFRDGGQKSKEVAKYAKTEVQEWNDNFDDFEGVADGRKNDKDSLEWSKKHDMKYFGEEKNEAKEGGELTKELPFGDFDDEDSCFESDNFAGFESNAQHYANREFLLDREEERGQGMYEENAGLEKREEEAAKSLDGDDAAVKEVKGFNEGGKQPQMFADTFSKSLEGIDDKLSSELDSHALSETRAETGTEAISETITYSTEWTCSYCTLSNRASSFACAACEKVRDNGSGYGWLSSIKSPTSFFGAFKTQLKVGFGVRKHGRRGKPRFRVVYLDEHEKEIKWKDDGDKKGRFAMYSRDRKIMVKDIKEVRTDGGTAVFSKALKAGAMNNGMNQPANFLISIVCRGGGKNTLDLEILSPEVYGILRRGFDCMVKEVNSGGGYLDVTA